MAGVADVALVLSDGFARVSVQRAPAPREKQRNGAVARCRCTFEGAVANIASVVVVVVQDRSDRFSWYKSVVNRNKPCLSFNGHIWPHLEI